MAYVNSEKTKEVRTKLNLAFPKSMGWEISVSMEHHSTINVAIMRAPVDFMIDARNEEDKNKGYVNFNVYHLGNYQTAEVLNQIKAIANEGNFDKSDLMTDYHHVGFYLNITAGKWNKPFQFNAPPVKDEPPTTEGAAVALPEETKTEETPEVGKLTYYQEEALKRLAETSASNPRPYAEMQPRSVRRAADRLALLGLAIRLQPKKEEKPVYYISLNGKLRLECGENPAALPLDNAPAPVEPTKTGKVVQFKPKTLKTPENAKPAIEAGNEPERFTLPLEKGAPVEFVENGISWAGIVTQKRENKIQFKISGECGNLANKPEKQVRWATRQELKLQILPKKHKPAAPRLRLVALPAVA